MLSAITFKNLAKEEAKEGKQKKAGEENDGGRGRSFRTHRTLKTSGKEEWLSAKQANPFPCKNQKSYGAAGSFATGF